MAMIMYSPASLTLMLVSLVCLVVVSLTMTTTAVYISTLVALRIAKVVRGIFSAEKPVKSSSKSHPATLMMTAGLEMSSIDQKLREAILGTLRTVDRDRS